MSNYYGEPENPRVTVQGWYGQFQTNPFLLDIVMSKYLPASVDELNALIVERHGENLEGKYETVIECLMVLAEFDGYASN
jgi:hypothetical protein